MSCTSSRVLANGPGTEWLMDSRTLWGSHVDTVTCLGDPRCIKDYVPPLDAEDLSMGVPEEERGVIPLWAMSIVDYVSLKGGETVMYS